MTLALPQFLHLVACATCLADRNGTTQKAANLGIWMMLGALLFIFTCLAVVVFNLARRARRAGQATPL